MALVNFARIHEKGGILPSTKKYDLSFSQVTLASRALAALGFAV